MIKRQIIMGMPVVIDVLDRSVSEKDIEEVFSYFRQIDERFSTYKKNSEISKINDNLISKDKYSPQMKKILALCEKTKKETNGYFDIENNGKLDPSGLVKGYAIWKGALMLKKKGFKNYYVEIAGDIQTSGKNNKNTAWKIGIKNPFNSNEIVKVVQLSGEGIATSGTYIRGDHIYNPVLNAPANSVSSVTIIGPNVYDADRFATAIFAMGKDGLSLIADKKTLAGYVVLKNKQAIYTDNFEKYVV